MLSIPLRMKHYFAGLWASALGLSLSIPLRMKLGTKTTIIFSFYAFNSFEDETMFEDDLVGFRREVFQFLWGWNNDLREKLKVNGNELSIPLRMKHILLQHGAKNIKLSIPLRMKHAKRRRIGIRRRRTTFNSFEDETFFWQSLISPRT